MKKLMHGVTLGLWLAAGTVLFSGPGCAGDRYHKSTGEVFDDAAITTKVKTEMFADKDVKGMDVKVKTFKGRVQLSGYVDSQYQKDRAGELAKQVKGVEWVKNDIIVKGKAP